MTDSPSDDVYSPETKGEPLFFRPKNNHTFAKFSGVTAIAGSVAHVKRFQGHRSKVPIVIQSHLSYSLHSLTLSVSLSRCLCLSVSLTLSLVSLSLSRSLSFSTRAHTPLLSPFCSLRILCESLFFCVHHSEKHERLHVRVDVVLLLFTNRPRCMHLHATGITNKHFSFGLLHCLQSHKNPPHTQHTRSSHVLHVYLVCTLLLRLY